MNISFNSSGCLRKRAKINSIRTHPLYHFISNAHSYRFVGQDKNLGGKGFIHS